MIASNGELVRCCPSSLTPSPARHTDVAAPLARVYIPKGCRPLVLLQLYPLEDIKGSDIDAYGSVTRPKGTVLVQVCTLSPGCTVRCGVTTQRVDTRERGEWGRCGLVRIAVPCCAERTSSAVPHV